MWLANNWYVPSGGGADLGPEATAFLFVLLLSPMALVVVGSRLWHLRHIKQRDKKYRDQAVDVWAEVSMSRGYEFRELGYQDMTISGQEGELEVSVSSTDDYEDAFRGGEDQIWSRVIISHRDGESLSDLELISRDGRGKAGALDPMGLIFQACYRTGDERDVNDQVPQRELRQKLLKLADKYANITVSYDQIQIEREELIVDREELLDLIDDALDLVR